MCAFVGEKSQIVQKTLLMIAKFFFLNILKTKCNRVRERSFFTLSRTLSCVVLKIFKKKNFTFINCAFVNNLSFSSTNAHICQKQVILDHKVLKMQRYSSVTLHVSPKNPISAEKLKIPFTKIQILPPNFFLSGLVQNKLKLYVFKMDLMTIQLKLPVPNKCGLRSWKGSNIWTMF